MKPEPKKPDMRKVIMLMHVSLDGYVAGPNGEMLVEPLSREEGILYAEVDPQKLLGSKWNLDVAGHYARPDAFRLDLLKKNLTASDRTEGDPEAEDAE